jgi:hypothetical protein
VPASSQTATKLLHLCPYNKTVIHKLNDTAYEARLHCVKWYPYGVLDGKIGPHLFCLAMKYVFLVNMCTFRITGTSVWNISY